MGSVSAIRGGGRGRLTAAAERSPDAKPFLLRRVTTPDDRAPVMVEPSRKLVGHAVAAPGQPVYAKAVRRHLRTLVSLPEREFALVELLATELFNNAAQHSRSGEPGGEVVVAVFQLPGRLQVRVIDAGPHPGEFTVPHLRLWDTDAEEGRGLFLVAAEADRWGTVHHDGGRTSVWFEIDHAQESRPGVPGEGR